MAKATPLILAIDQGTTSSRALLFDATGTAVHVAQRELPLITPQSGWVEQNGEKIWGDVLALCREVLAKVDINDVIGIGITNQRETTLVWDKQTGKPVYNAIVWQDRRTAAFCETLKPHADMIQKKTGLIVDPYFSGTKIRWILESFDYHPDDIMFGTIDSYLLWHLTGGKIHATDASNASRTMIFDIHKQIWDTDLCHLLEIPVNILPDIYDTVGHFGETADGLFEKPLPVLAMAGDQQAATFGQCCFEKGDVKATYGTGCFALMNTGDICVQSRNRLLSTVAWRIGGYVTYAVEGSIFVAGAAIQFLRDNLGFIETAPQSESLATSVGNADGVVFVPAFTGLGAPYWNPDVRGAIMGLSRGTSQAHIARAALDAQAYQTRDLVQAMKGDADTDIATIRVDGGLATNDYVCQAIADQTGCIIDRPVNTESTAWGVAAMAFMQAGIFLNFDDVRKTYRLDRQFVRHQGKDKKIERDYSAWTDAVTRLQ